MKKTLIALMLTLALGTSVAQRPALVSPVIRFSDNNGLPLAFGTLQSFAAGTTTPLPTYSDSTSGTLNTNPITLDATGSATVFLGPNVYKLVLKNAAGVVQWTADNIAQGAFEASYVNSVFGRTGTVAAQTGDYTCAQVTGAICALPTLYNQTIAVSGTPVAQEPTLNFIAGVSGSISPVITVTSGGSGYTGAPSVAFSGGSCTVEPTGSSTVASGTVTSVVAVTLGSGCTSAPTIAFSGGGGTGAAATATVPADGISCVDNSGAQRTDCTMTFGGGSGGSSTIVQNDVTSTRMFNTTYQNTTTTPMYVSGYGLITGGAGDSSGVCMNGPSAATINVWATTYSFTVPGEAAGFSCFVPPSYFYQVTMNHNVYSTPGSWIETTGFGGGGGGGGGGPTLQTNGSANASQALLNLISGNGITLSNSGGGVTISQGPLFAISSFVASTAGTYELGQTVASPTNFTASYTSTPTSASVSDGTNTATLTTPFTSGSLAYSYSLSSAGCVTFTLTAVGPTTQTATQQDCFSPRVFGGVGTAGATGATASGTTAVLAGATGTLTSNGLGQQSTWGPYSPSSQYIYVLALGSACSFTSGGFAFLMNSPTFFSFTNQNGSAVSMYLYRSVNSQNATTTLVGSC